MNRLALVLAALLPAVAVAAARPIVIHHTGRLLTSDDAPLSTGVSLTVGLFASKDATTAGWSESYDVIPSGGIYHLALGAETGKKALTADDVTNNPYLGISVGTVALTPRLVIGVVPFAVSAATADLATTALTANNALRLGDVAAADYATKSYVDSAGYARLGGASFTGAVVVPTPTDPSQAATKAYVDAAAAAVAPTGYAKLDSPAFTGNVVVPTPTDPGQAATKAYVDAAAAAVAPVGFARLDGATFSGPVKVPAPTVDTSASTKKYVDDTTTSRNDPRWLYTDPRMRNATKVSSVKLTSQPAGGGARVIQIDGQNVATGDLSGNGLYLLVLDATTHLPVTGNSNYDANYDVNNGTNGANIAVTLQVALASTTASQIVLIVAKGPSYTNFGAFAKDLIDRGGVPMSYFTFKNGDLYMFAGRKGLGVAQAVEVIKDQRTGAQTAEFLLVDGVVVAPRELHRTNRIVDYMRADDDRIGATGTVDFTYYSLDGKAGPFKFYSTGKPLHLYFEFMNYLQADPSGTTAYTTLAMWPVIDGVRQSYCGEQFQRTQDRHDTQVCDATFSVAPGEHTISFDHGKIGYRTIVYSDNLRSRIVIDEIDP